MGLDLEHVISDARHHGAFICAICQNLADLDCLVTTACSHVFCKQCLPIWLVTKNKATCPTCNQDLLYINNNNGNGRCMMMGSHSVMVQPLEGVQPLAHRLLKSIAVKCPMRKGVDCQWEGSLSDLQTHLLSSTAHGGDAAARTAPLPKTSSPSTPHGMETSDTDMGDDSLASMLQAHKKNHLSLAASLKEEANGQFEINRYNEANSLYTKAISVLSPYYGDNDKDKDEDEDSTNIMAMLTTLYSNRAATYLSMQEYNRSLDDCNYALQKLDSTNVKIYVRAIRSCIQLGQLKKATGFVNRGLQQKGGNKVLLKEECTLELMMEWEDLGTSQLKSQEYAHAKTHYSNLLKKSPSAIPFLLGVARSDLGLGLTDSALRLTKRILMQHAQNPQGCWVRGQALFLMGEYKSGIQLLQEALRLDPDDEDIKKSYKMAKKVKDSTETAQQKMFSRQFTQAVDLAALAIQQYQPILPPKSLLYATLTTLRAQAFLRLKQYKESLKECALVLYAQEDHIPAWLIRIQAYHGLEDHETALNEVNDVLSKFPEQPELRKAHEQADFLLRKQRRTNYYELLDCSPIASEIEIKKAYKRKALQLHPDRIAPGSSQEKVAEAQRNFQLLGEGLEILCDDFMRKLYDDGYDSGAIRERVEAAKQAAHRHTGGYHHRPHHHGW